MAARVRCMVRANRTPATSTWPVAGSSRVNDAMPSAALPSGSRAKVSRSGVASVRATSPAIWSRSAGGSVAR